MLNDLRYAWRALARTPGFSALAVLTLALGIGVNTAMFSVISGVLLTPLPYRDPTRIVRFGEGRPDYLLNISYPNFLDWRVRARSFDEMAIFNQSGRTIVNLAGVAEAVPSGTAEARLFSMLGMTPVRGRLFSADEERAGAPRVVVISYRLWQRLGGADAIVGREIGVGSSVTVVGVLPPDLPMTTDVWYSLTASLSAMQLDRGNHPGFQAYGRLREGVDLEAARREMSGIAADLERQYPETNHQMGVFVRPLLDTVVGGSAPILRVLAGAVGLLLLIACANLTNALLARGLRRERETAVRAALGAGRARLARLFVCESLVMSLCGGAAGVLIAAWSVRALRVAPGLTLPRLANVAIDTRVLAYAVAVSIVTGIVCGLAPAIQLSRGDLMSSLRLASAGSALPGGRRLRGVLVTLEVALSLMLLAGAGLMIRSLAQLASVDPGYRADGLVSVSLQQPPAAYAKGSTRLAFMERVLDDLHQTPGIEDAAAAWPFDLVGNTWAPYVIVHDKPVPRGQEPPVRMAAVTPSFFRTLGIPLRRGRLFDSQDQGGAPMTIVVNETFVRTLLPEGDPLGRRVSFVGIPELARAEIIGVVADTLRLGLAGGALPEVYGAYTQFSVAGATIIVRAASGDPLALTPVIQSRIAGIDPLVATYGARRTADALSSTIGDRRMLSWLLTLFAGLALALTAVGIAGVMSYVVAQRTWEIGVRMALGADATSVLRTILTSVMTPVVIGVALGMAATVPFARALTRYLFQVGPADVVAMSGATVVLIAAALAAAYIPARRATRIDPLVALRE